MPKGVYQRDKSRKHKRNKWKSKIYCVDCRHRINSILAVCEFCKEEKIKFNKQLKLLVGQSEIKSIPSSSWMAVEEYAILFGWPKFNSSKYYDSY